MKSAFTHWSSLKAARDDSSESLMRGSAMHICVREWNAKEDPLSTRYKPRNVLLRSSVFSKPVFSSEPLGWRRCWVLAPICLFWFTWAKMFEGGATWPNWSVSIHMRGVQPAVFIQSGGKQVHMHCNQIFCQEVYASWRRLLAFYTRRV